MDALTKKDTEERWADLRDRFRRNSRPEYWIRRHMRHELRTVGETLAIERDGFGPGCQPTQGHQRYLDSFVGLFEAKRKARQAGGEEYSLEEPLPGTLLFEIEEAETRIDEALVAWVEG